MGVMLGRAVVGGDTYVSLNDIISYLKSQQIYALEDEETKAANLFKFMISELERARV